MTLLHFDRSVSIVILGRIISMSYSAFMKRFYRYIKAEIFLSVLAASLLVILSGCISSSEKKSVTFRVVTNNLLTTETVYLTGSNEVLGKWRPDAVKLDKQSDSVWTKTLSFDEGERIEYKLTLGSWISEAVKPGGWTFRNFILDIKNDTSCTIRIDNWLNHVYKRIVKAEFFSDSQDGFELVNNWLYHPGDNPQWATAEVNDTSWEIIKSRGTDSSFISKLKNTGWYRTHLIIDSSLWNKTFAFRMRQLGSSEIYYNGRLLYSFPSPKTDWQKFTFDASPDQVFAVKYINPKSTTENALGFEPGFSILITHFKFAINTINDMRSNTIHQMVFTLIPVILSFLHLFLYFFYRKQKQNLYYAFCLLGFAGLTYFNYERFLLDDAGWIIFFQRMNVISASTAIFFATLTLFQIRYNRLPKRWLVYLALYIIMLISGFIDISPQMNTLSIYIFFGLTLIEGLYSAFSKKNVSHKGAWIIFVGFIIMGSFIVMQVLVDFSLVTNLFGTNELYVYGMIAFAVSMSLYLSYNFAYVNKDLESQLIRVKELSDKTIEQERIASKLEIERRLIEAENLRKSNELNSARELQLSLLPQKVPQSDKVEIACYMKTATEVGGDYYDFHITDDNTLTAVIGDATGHGLKAGNMVILAKGLFNTLANEPDLLTIMSTFNHSIKRMNMHMLTMCMSLIRIKDHTIEYSSAGMPPMHIYRQSTGEVEQLLLKGMPLGAFYNFPYQKRGTDICPGDVILLMSDGLIELFNEHKETYGLDNIIDSFKARADKPAEEIINHIFTESKAWAGDRLPDDDLTMMIIKIKE